MLIITEGMYRISIAGKNLTSASRVIRFPSGQIIWSTCERTFSQDKSAVRKLPYKSL